jgi:hypothetical protein
MPNAKANMKWHSVIKDTNFLILDLGPSSAIYRNCNVQRLYTFNTSSLLFNKSKHTDMNTHTSSGIAMAWLSSAECIHTLECLHSGAIIYIITEAAS